MGESMSIATVRTIFYVALVIVLFGGGFTLGYKYATYKADTVDDAAIIKAQNHIAEQAQQNVNIDNKIGESYEKTSNDIISKYDAVSLPPSTSTMPTLSNSPTRTITTPCNERRLAAQLALRDAQIKAWQTWYIQESKVYK